MTAYRDPQPRMVQASLKQYFLTGLLVMIPIWGTILILKTLFVSLMAFSAMHCLAGDSRVPCPAGIIAPSCSFLRPACSPRISSVTMGAAGAAAQSCASRARGSIPLKSMMDILSFAEREAYRRVVLIQFPERSLLFCTVTGATKGEMQQLSRIRSCTSTCRLAQSHIQVFCWCLNAK